MIIYYTTTEEQPHAFCHFSLHTFTITHIYKQAHSFPFFSFLLFVIIQNTDGGNENLLGLFLSLSFGVQQLFTNKLPKVLHACN